MTLFLFFVFRLYTFSVRNSVATSVEYGLVSYAYNNRPDQDLSVIEQIFIFYEQPLAKSTKLANESNDQAHYFFAYPAHYKSLHFLAQQRQYQ